MGLTFSLVASIFFYRYFTMTVTLHMVEETMSDPAMPFLQSLSYSTTKVQCEGKWVRIYDLLSAAVASKSKDVVACGNNLNLKTEVERQLKNLEKISNFCFDYGMADSENKELDIVKFEKCAETISASGKSEKSRTHASYLFPLPPAQGLVARHVLTTVKSAEATPTATSTSTPVPTPT